MLQVLVAPAADGAFVSAEDAVDAGPGRVDASESGLEARRRFAMSAAADDMVTTHGSARTGLSRDASAGEFRVAPTAGAVEAVPEERTWVVTLFPALPGRTATERSGGPGAVDMTESVRAAARPPSG